MVIPLKSSCYLDAADSKAIPPKKPSYQNNKIDDTQMIKCVLKPLLKYYTAMLGVVNLDPNLSRGI